MPNAYSAGERVPSPLFPSCTSLALCAHSLSSLGEGIVYPLPSVVTLRENGCAGVHHSCCFVWMPAAHTISMIKFLMGLTFLAGHHPPQQHLLEGA